MSSIKEVVKRFVSFIGSKIPTTNIISFSSFPDLSDNAYAMFEYLVNKGVDKEFTFYWFILERDRVDELSKQIYMISTNTKAIYKYTIKGLWIYIRSRYVFETHAMFPDIKLKQHADKHISLWHGMPLKKLGGSIGDPSSPNMNYTIATSKKYQEIMAEAFGTDLNHVLITGQPRCDLLFEKTDWFETVGVNSSKFDKIGMWMPTYRKSIVGDIRTDGDFEEGAIAFLKEPDLLELDKHLNSINCLLLVKIHPMDALINYNFKNFTNIIIIKPAQFKNQLYPLLGNCDFLLTDYSSVFIDYQITGKPMAFVMDDIDSYKNSRGLYFENLESILPGPIISSKTELFDYLANVPKKGVLGDLFNQFYDNRSSERIAKKLGIV